MLRQRRTEHLGMDLDAVCVREPVVASPADGEEPSPAERPRIRLRFHDDLVRQLVADYRQRPVEDVGHEDLPARLPRGDRSSELVDWLEDHDAFEEMQDAI